MPYFVFKRFGWDNGGLPLPEPVINRSGDVRFFACLGGPVGTADSAVYVHSDDQWRSVARRFTTVPGYPSGTSFESFLSAQLVENGDVVLSARLTGPHVSMGQTDRGVWHSSASQFTELARTGSPAPQTNPPALYTALEEPLLSQIVSPHQVIIPALTRNSATLFQEYGAFAPLQISPRRMMEGYAAPGIAGAVLSSLVTVPRNDGAVLYQGTLTGDGVQQVTFGSTTLLNDEALWADDGINSSQVVARKGQVLPAGGGSVALASVYSDSRGPASAADGSVLFAGPALNTSTGTSAGDGLWKWRNGQVEPQFLTGDSIVNAAGLTMGAVANAGTVPKIYACDGSSVYAAKVAGPGATYLNDLALFESSTGGPHMIARARHQAPGTPEGAIFTSSSLLSKVVCGKNSNWAFTGQLQGTGVTANNDRGIWAVSNGEAQLAIREWDQVGQYRIVEIPSLTGDLHITDDGRVVALVNLAYASSPYGARYAALVSWTSCAGTSILLGVGIPLSLDDGSSRTLSNFRIDQERALNGSGTLAAAVKFTSTLPDDEALVTTEIPSCGSCRADFDRSGSVNTADIFSFLTVWFAQSVEADFDNSGTVAVPDILAFLNVWFEGC